LVAELANLINEDRARLLGVVRQEVLSGIRDRQRFETIRLQLRAFLDVQLDADDYEAAAEASNLCRSAGVAGSPVDFLLVATAARRSWSIFTTDLDFGLYAAHYPLTLHVPRRSE
jgi:predicted nucleic acid-binding protein